MKRSRKMLILTLVLVLMVGATLGVKTLTQTESVTETEETIPLTTLTADDVTGLAWTCDGVSYHFTKKDGAWHNADDAAFPASTDALNDMAEDLAALTATRTISGVTSIADYGLGEPAFTLTAEWSDGTTVTYSMGDALPFGDGYYLGLSTKTDVVYAVEDALDDLFAKAGTELASLEDMPTAENVTRLTVGDTLDAALAETSTTLDPDQLWYAADGTALQYSSVEELIEAAQGITWYELVYTSADEDTLTACGLDEASAVKLTLYDGNTEALVLLIGGAADSTHRYAKLPDSGMIYTVSSTNTSTLLTATAESLAVTDLLPMEYEDVQAAVLTAGQYSVVFSGVPVEVAEEDTEESAEAAESTEEEAEDPYPALWEQVVALSGDSYEGESDAAAEVVLTIEVTSITGVQETLTFYGYDVDSYLATCADGSKLLISADDVDKIIRTIRQIK